jgi:hypothetical protein
MLLTALGQNRIDGKRAAPMLYNLQIATQNLRNLTQFFDDGPTDVVTGEHGEILAPDEDPVKPIFDDDEDEDDDDEDDDDEDEDEDEEDEDEDEDEEDEDEDEEEEDEDEEDEE